jgi:hypothetical protein
MVSGLLRHQAADERDLTHRAPSHWTKGQVAVSRKDNIPWRDLALVSVPVKKSAHKTMTTHIASLSTKVGQSHGAAKAGDEHAF